MFATGCALTALGEVIVKTRAQDFGHRIALGSLIVVAGVIVHYLVACLRDAHRELHPRPALASAMR